MINERDRTYPDFRPMTAGEELYKLVAELYPICRSITGDGVRRTLEIVDREIGGLEVSEVPTGTQVLDWTVPREWNVRDAWVANAAGERVIDFQASNLHLVSYSVPVRATMPWPGSRAPVHPARPARPGALPDLLLRRALGLLRQPAPDRQPARGRLRGLRGHDPGRRPPHLRRAPGRGPDRDEVLVSCHVCHPSLANDNLSGIAVASRLARLLGEGPRLQLPVPVHPGRSARSPGWPATRTGSTASATAWSCPASATRAGSPTSAAAAATPRSTGPWPTCSPAPAGPTGWSTSRPTATTSASSARPASTCRSAASAAPSSPPTPSTTPRPTTSTWSARPSSRTAWRCAGRWWRCWRAPPLPEPQPQGRAPAGQARALRQHRRPQRRRGAPDGHAVGAEPVRRRRGLLDVAERSACRSPCWPRWLGAGGGRPAGRGRRAGVRGRWTVTAAARPAHSRRTRGSHSSTARSASADQA